MSGRLSGEKKENKQSIVRIDVFLFGYIHKSFYKPRKISRLQTRYVKFKAFVFIKFLNFKGNVIQREKRRMY